MAFLNRRTAASTSYFILVLYTVLLMNGSANGQSAAYSSTEICQEKNQKTKKLLDSDSIILQGILSGRTGDGLEHPWRGKMRELGFRRIAAGVRFQIADGTLSLVEIANLATSTKYDRFEDSVTKSSTSVSMSKEELILKFRFPIYARALQLLEGYSIKSITCGELYVNLLDDACLPIYGGIPSIGSKCDAEPDVTPRY